MYTRDAVDAFVSVTKYRGLLPSHFEISDIGNLVCVNLFNSVHSAIITESVATGVSREPHVALMKAIVEWIERRTLDLLFRDPDEFEVKRHHGSDGSDGVAAFPRFSDDGFSEETARQNAYCEALERFIWARWWDNSNVAAKVSFIEASDPLLCESFDCYSLIQHSTPIDKLVLVRPQHNDRDHEVIVAFGQLSSGGWISGGAAGNAGESSHTVFRGMVEMMRHSLAFSRMNRDRIAPTTFYEQRLHYFASGQGNQLLDSRIHRRASEQIQLPELEIDVKLSHPNDDIVSCHRVLFHDQPMFIGGDVARLCL